MNRFIISNNQKHDLVFYTLHLIVEFEYNVAANARQPWTDSSHSCSEYLIIPFDYLIT